MNKIDVILFRYNKEREISEELKRLVWKMAIPLLLLLMLDIIAIFLCSMLWGWLLLGFCAIGIFIWTKLFEAKWGPKKWKYKLFRIYRNRFIADQSKLIEIISEEGMNCQQVYNLLAKKHNRLPQSVDNRSYVVTILSLVIALTGILVSPLKNFNMEDYLVYLSHVISVFCVVGMFGYVLYRFLGAQNAQYDEKKSNYEYVLELLEDYLY